MDEVWPGVPARDVQLDQLIPRYPEGGDVLNPRPRVITEVAGWRDADQPFFAAKRSQALGDPPMPCNSGEAKPDVRQVHDPQPRLAIAPGEPCPAAPGLGTV